MSGWNSMRKSATRAMSARAIVLGIIIAISISTAAFAAGPPPAVMPGSQNYQPKDFTLFRDGDWYHCFYIEVPNSNPTDTGTRIGHSRSRDLSCWEYMGSPFGPDPNGWDNSRVWAPHIIKVDGVFYMFYTGVSSDTQHPQHQRIGVATSSDLVSWTHRSVPLMECSIATWAQCLSGTNYGGQLRDPFVMPDPGTPGRWLAYYGANISWNDMVAGVATSSSLGTVPWSDAGPLFTQDPNSWWTYQGKVESPHLVQHGTNWDLFFTNNSDTAGISLWTNDNPLGGGSTWTPRGSFNSMLRATMQGNIPASQTWHASEYFKDTDNTEYFACIDGVIPRKVLIYKIGTWSNDWKFTLDTPTLLHVNSVTYQTATGSSITEGALVDITINATNWQGKSVTLEALEKDPGQPDQVLGAGTLSLPSPITLTGPSTVVTWQSTFVPDDDGSPNRMEVSFRAVGYPCAASPVLYVQKHADGDHDPYYTDVRARRGAGEPEPGALPAAEAGPRLRALRETPLGSGIGLLVDLPEATSARLDVFDPLGRRVRLLADRPFPKGASVEMWDGRSDAGTAAVTGVYFARLRTATGVRVARFFFSPR